VQVTLNIQKRNVKARIKFPSPPPPPRCCTISQSMQKHKHYSYGPSIIFAKDRFILTGRLSVTEQWLVSLFPPLAAPGALFSVQK